MIFIETQIFFKILQHKDHCSFSLMHVSSLFEFKWVYCIMRVYIEVSIIAYSVEESFIL